jgi:putative hydrolase of the HAD superfamily
MELCAGIVDRLDEARQKGLKVGVASGSPREWVVGHLTRRGLVDHFQMIICCEDTTEHKPRPAPFLAVAGGLKVEPADCLVLEDSPNGIRSAHLAGMKAVAVPNPLTRTMEFPGADLVIESLSQTTLGKLAEKLWPEPESD